MKGTRPLDNDEIRRVSTCFTGTFEIRNRGLFMLGVSTGGRISELLSLQVGDVYQNTSAVSLASLHNAKLGLDFSLKSVPKLDFSDAEFTGVVSTSYDLGVGFSLNVAYQGVYETERRKYFGSLIAAVTWEQ